ncbi:MAG TPA: Fe-S cluster assembly protein SufD [Xanthobacteraceae bacterium]|nr:Fe-S cluster assembly protein SufD [Xanthobacteraceae bacterium]
MAAADLKVVKSAAETALAAEYAMRKAALAGNAAIARERDKAFARFERAGLPNRRVEQWKYTDLRALMREARPVAPPPDAAAKERAKSAGNSMAGVHAHRIVFVDGAFVPELSTQDAIPGVRIYSLASELARGDGAGALPVAVKDAGDDPAVALNQAFAADGAVIHIARNTIVEKPLHLVFTHSGPATAVYARSRVVVDDGAQVTLIETHEGPDQIGYQVNAALALFVGNRANVNHVKLSHEGDAALHVATLTAAVGEGASFRHFTFTLDGAVTRNQLFVSCTGKNADLNVSGVSLLRGREHADTTLVLDHAIGGCTSREIFKSVLDDESQGVFQGKIIVRPDAQKTDARMMMRALLLSEDAEADHKPELEIFADDVQCGHGSTAGRLEDNLKFYLMARGIPEPEAEALLIQAFIGEAVETVAHHGIRDALMFSALRWLGERK